MPRSSAIESRRVSAPNTHDTPAPMLQRHSLAFGFAVVLAVLGVALLVAMGQEAGKDFAQGIDDWVRDRMQAAQWTGLRGLAVALEIAGSWYITWPLRIAIVVYLARAQRWEQFWAWTAAIVLYEPLVGLLKGLYERPRPPLAGEFNSFSFPSGHAVVGAALAIGIVIVLVPAGPRRRRWEYAAGGFALFMALSRVYLDAHWFSDVVAGSFIGAAVMIGTTAIVHRIYERRRVPAQHS